MKTKIPEYTKILPLIALKISPGPESSMNILNTLLSNESEIV